MNRRLSSSTIIDILKELLLLNGIFLLCMTLFRLVFYFYYHTGATSLHNFLLLKAFVLGARFDLVVVAYINILVTFTYVIVFALSREKVLQVWLWFVRFYYGIMYSLVFLILCVDFGFYSYFKSHINILIFGIFEDDTKALFSTLSQNYNLPLVVIGFGGLFIVIFLVCFQVLRLRKKKPAFFAKPLAWKYKVVLATMLVVLNALAARGSFGLFPLGLMDAEISPDVFINKLSINGLFTLQEAIEYRMKENHQYDLTKLVGYGGNPRKAFADFLGVPISSLPEKGLESALIRRTGKNAALERLRPNVVIIMMESFGADLMRYQSDSFNVLGELKKHFDSDYLFMNFLSGDVGTIGSIETVLMNVPKRPMAKPLSQSRYAYRPHPTGAAWAYKKAGYDTIFLYSGNTGWRNVQNFMPTLGFDAFEGEGSMDPHYLRNQWGVYDEFLFDYIFGKLAHNNGKSKFIFAMTTTNHPPYSLPATYTPLPLTESNDLEAQITGDKKLAYEHFKTYQYANQKLGEFITRVKNSEFGKNTIIAVTGDHNFWAVFDYPAERYLDRDGVPFYLYVPQNLRPRSVDTTVFGSHVDIMPTLYNLSLSKAEFMALGNDLLNKKNLHTAYNVDGIILDKMCGVKYTPENNTSSFFRWDPKDPRRLISSAVSEEHERLLTFYKSAIAVTEYVIRRPIAEHPR